MTLTNNTPFQFAFLCGKGPMERENIVFIVKGTFDLMHNQVCQVAGWQLPIFQSDQHRSDPATSSVIVESDYVLHKPKTDVVLLGKAYVPGGIATESCEVTMSINEYRQNVRVIGDRTWTASGQQLFIPSDPQKFTTRDLIFENAFGGGKDESNRFGKNPVGKGFHVAVEQPLPNLEDPDHLIENSALVTDQFPEPKCFAWHGKSWQPRLGKAGEADELGKHAPHLPPSFDWEFNNGASSDFIRPYLTGNEAIALQNCDPSGYFRFRLPGAGPRLIAEFAFSEDEIDLVLDTVCIMMETTIEVENVKMQIHKQAYLVWRGKIAIDDQRRLNLLRNVVMDKIN
ncbi:DUF2169 domain-containing protein [bacterium]|nr:DUF2169 domain-containing protein [bacterium]